ncbi:hypothetical protein VKT23_013206 [Stygiomarasmius scandens]|uniref:Uncharacterized protein n=1 Tax=Marasmiellus scandens TaxID=2682957 RepID=A0ABR1J6I3_9AGAR
MTPRKIRLSPADQKIAEELGRKLFYYETSTENHAAALRADPTGYSQAYREYLTLSPAPMGTLPEPNDMDRCIREAEELLAKECITPLDHLFAVNAGVFLGHAFTKKLNEYRSEIVTAAFAHDHELTSQLPTPEPQPAIFPPDILELMALDPNRVFTSDRVGEPTFTGNQPTLNSNPWPISMPTTSVLTWSNILGYPSSPVTSETLASYKLSPQSVLRRIFVSFEAGEPVEAFRVISVTLQEQGVIFYLLFVDHDEGIGYPSEDFYDLIAEMEQVQVE